MVNLVLPFPSHSLKEKILFIKTFTLFRVEAFNTAFLTLRRLLPTLPPDKKLSKIEILRLSICYITYLRNVLEPGEGREEDEEEDEEDEDLCGLALDFD